MRAHILAATLVVIVTLAAPSAKADVAEGAQAGEWAGVIVGLDAMCGTDSRTLVRSLRLYGYTMDPMGEDMRDGLMQLKGSAMLDLTRLDGKRADICEAWNKIHEYVAF